jgi:hypothetical protein
MRGNNRMLADEMRDKYKFIFLKASTGWRGKQVLSIEKIEGWYNLNFYKNGLRQIVLEDLERLKDFVDAFIKRRKFIIQQGIKLLKVNGRNMDMRIFVVKDGTGEWKCAHIQCRIAKETSTITNYSAGG